MTHKAIGAKALVALCNTQIAAIGATDGLQIAPSNIENWKQGKRSKKIRDRRQLIVLAYMLEVSTVDFECLLVICKHPPLQTLFTQSPIEYQQLLQMWLDDKILAELSLAQVPIKDYRQFIGRTQDVEVLMSMLLPQSDRQIISIIGIPGLGKTALAQKIVRDFAESQIFQAISWIEWEPQTGKQRKLAIEQIWRGLLSQLAQALQIPHDLVFTKKEIATKEALKRHSYLIVIDDFELHPQAAEVLSRLNDLIGRSKVLLISQNYLPHHSLVHRHDLLELSKADTSDFLEHLTDATTAQSQVRSFDTEIYQTIGGHPQALLLVSQLVYEHSVESVLNEFRESNIQEIQETYDDIYQQLWSRLSRQARQMLFAMCLSPKTGCSERYLLIFCDLSRREISEARQQLRRLGLLIMPQDEVHYKIHHLTETYLLANQTRLALTSDKALQTQLSPMVFTLCTHWLEKAHQFSVQDARNHYSELFKLLRIGITYAQKIETWNAVTNLLRCITPFMENHPYWFTWEQLLQPAISKSPDPSSLFNHKLLSYLGWFQRLHSKLTDAILSHHKALELADKNNDGKAKAGGHMALCVDYRSARQYALAEKHGKEALNILGQLQLGSRYFAPVFNSLGINAHWSLQVENAYSYFKSSIQHYEADSNHYGLSRAYNNWANVLTDCKLFDEAQKVFDKAQYHAIKSEGAFDEEIVTISMCHLYLEQGALSHAQKICQLPMFDYQKSQSPLYHRALMAMYYGRLRLEMGDSQAAVMHLENAIDSWKEMEDGLYLLESSALLAQAKSACGDWFEATKMANFVIISFSELQDDPRSVFVYEKYAQSLSEIKQKGQP